MYKRKNLKFDPVRVAAVEALVLVEQGEQSDNAVKNVSRGKNFRPIDNRFLMQLVNGAVKMRRRLDHEIKFYLAKPSIKLPILLTNILRLGMYQLRFTDKIPAAAAVNESVNICHHMLDKRRANLANAVLRAAIREPKKVKYISKEENPVKYLADFYSFPDFFVEYCLKEFDIENTEILLKKYNLPPRVTYRVNYLKAKPEEISEFLTEKGIKFSPGSYLNEFLHIESGGLPFEEELIESGKVFVQDESSGLPVRLLNPRPGSSVIDLAAAPGGKATYCAVKMRNKGRVTAIDKSHNRLELLVKNSNRLGINIISPVVCDMGDFKGGPFDRVILDPPCTGWGTAGKHSDLRWSKKPDDITNLAKIQNALIDKAAQLVKPGGVMVYSTCTIIREENDQIVEEFLLRNQDFEIESATEYFDEKIVNARGFVKTYPLTENMDGSFCARLRKKI